MEEESMDMRMSRVESSIRIVLDYHKAFNRNDVTGMMQLFSDDGIFEHRFPAPDGTRYSGKEAIARFWKNHFLEYPESHIEIEQIFGFGFRCVMRWRYDWKDAAGKKEHQRGVDIFQIKEGFLCEQLSYVKG
jgi:hypothetical protein